jgi:AcrR family transcriptional regulator
MGSMASPSEATGRVRPHTGRRRNDAARRAVLDATAAILAEDGPDGLTIDAVARRARVGRQTIYRWWPSRAAIVGELASESARLNVPSEPDTGSLEGDLRAFLRASYTTAARPENAAMLRGLASEALRDASFAEVLADFTARRRAVLRALLERHGADPRQAELLAELGFALIWYRTIARHRKPDRRAADATARVLATAVSCTPR